MVETVGIAVSGVVLLELSALLFEVSDVLLVEFENIDNRIMSNRDIGRSDKADFIFSYLGL